LAADSDSDVDACLALVAGLYAYNTRLEVPKMSAFGIDAGAYVAAQAAMAADALRSGAPALNPKIADQTQITDLYKKAWA
jgi:alcohol dehydrogenase class IV